MTVLKQLVAVVGICCLFVSPVGAVEEEHKVDSEPPPNVKLDEPPKKDERPRPSAKDPEPGPEEELSVEEKLKIRNEEPGSDRAESQGKPSRIFKTRDRHGNVMFTDDPQAAEQQGGEEVELRRGNDLPLRVPEGAMPSAGGGQQKQNQAVDYQITIQSPTSEQNIHNPGGPIPVSVSVQPNPAKGHQLVIEYNGVTLEKPEIPWPQDRGEHTVTARVVDGEGNVIATSEPRVFYIHRASKLLPPNN